MSAPKSGYNTTLITVLSLVFVSKCDICVYIDMQCARRHSQRDCSTSHPTTSVRAKSYSMFERPGRTKTSKTESKSTIVQKPRNLRELRHA
ncbi:hypothetical protein C8Q78DRAFT_1000769 [Trametes maxima]|nr:hypothetical protein C8Q78DRAFT_1000769 [Trametes maxima]